MIPKKIKTLFIAATAICLLLSAGTAAFAQMESSILFVAPHRILMNPTEKVEVINVANKSDQTHRYDLTLIDQVMNDQGMTLRQDTFDYSAKRMIRFVPKRFTLKPGERQIVRVMVKRPEGLADGDYHSHLLFREVPLSVQDKQTLKDVRSEQNKEKKVNFEIRALYGVAVPIVVQHGKIESDILLGDASFIPATDKVTASLSVKFERTGNAEAAGQVGLSYIKAEGGEPIQLIEPIWVRLYHEVNTVTRNIQIKDMPEGVKLSGGKIVLTLSKAGAEIAVPTADGKQLETKTEDSVIKEIQLP